MASLNCSYCGQPARLATGADVYPGRAKLAKLRFWKCDPCEAWVGCHPPREAGGKGDGTIPLGTLADAQLRQWRSSVHALLDPLWKSGRRTRGEVYAWLGKRMGLPGDQCHTGGFTIEQCKQAARHLAELDP